MTLICECCGRPLEADPPADPVVADPVAELRAWCLARGLVVLPGDLVRTDTAALVLGMKPQSLRTDRCYAARIPCRRVGGRVVYDLRDLALLLR